VTWLVRTADPTSCGLESPTYFGYGRWAALGNSWQRPVVTWLAELIGLAGGIADVTAFAGR